MVLARTEFHDLQEKASCGRFFLDESLQEFAVPEKRGTENPVG